MKFPKCVFAFIWIVLSIAGFDSISAFAQFPQVCLKSIPAESPYVFVINMQRFTESPQYARFLREKDPMSSMINALASFSYSTGAVPARDVSYLILASDGQGAIMIATGRFELAKIYRYIQCSMYPEEMAYRGAPILLFPSQAGNMGIAFISKEEIALGPLDQLKTILDTTVGARKDILSNPRMAELLGAAPPNEMFWFTGISTRVLALLSIPYPLPSSTDTDLKSITGILNLTDSLVGRIDIATKKQGAAKSLAKTWDMKSGLWKQPQSYTMLGLKGGGLTVNQNGTQIGLSLNVTPDMLERVWTAKSGSEPGETVKAPVHFLKPMPPYTEEARKAKIEGTMQIQLFVPKNGFPNNIKIIKGLGYGLDESAISTITDLWYFLPALRNGAPMEARMTIDVPFKLEDNKWK